MIDAIADVRNIYGSGIDNALASAGKINTKKK